MKGVASKHRVAILNLLARTPHLDVDTIAGRLSLGYKTTAVHLSKLAYADIIEKEDAGYYVLHSLTPRGKQIHAFLKRLR